MAKTKQAAGPAPIVVLFGDEPYQKTAALTQTLDALLPPEVDRSMALADYDGTAPEDAGGPTFSAVADDLATLPFLADRRVVLIRDADKFITASREKLERWLESPPPTGTLVLECRGFPKTTRLYKAAVAAGGQIHECKKLSGRALVDFALEAAQARGKRLAAAAAQQLVNLIGSEQQAVDAELEKLALYVGDRREITAADIAELVGLSREEKIFAVMDAAGVGRLPQALRLWHDVLTTDPQAVYRALGGMAYVLRRWLAAHQMAADGMSAAQIAPKVMMYGRIRELETILRRLPAARVAALLAALADLDAQAKTGGRSIETGIEGVLINVATPAA